jgi:hypothetical protein
MSGRFHIADVYPLQFITAFPIPNYTINKEDLEGWIERSYYFVELQELDPHFDARDKFGYVKTVGMKGS